MILLESSPLLEISIENEARNLLTFCDIQQLLVIYSSAATCLLCARNMAFSMYEAVILCHSEGSYIFDSGRTNNDLIFIPRIPRAFFQER